MKNKLFLAGLSLTLALAPTILAEASDSSDTDMAVTSVEKEEVQYNFYEVQVNKVTEDEVTLAYLRTTKPATYSNKIAIGYEFKLPRELFDEDVGEKDVYELRSTKDLEAITKDDLTADDIKLVNKLEKSDNKENNGEFENMAIDKIPEDHEVMEFEILEIDKDIENPSAILAEVGNPDNKYAINLENLLDKYPGIGDIYKIYWDGVALKSYPAQFGKIYRVEKVKLDHYDESYTKSLAISMFDSLVQTEAASILLDQTPKTVEKIEPSLTKLMGNANTLMEDAYTTFLTEEEREKGSKDTALLKILEYKYDKKLENKEDKELALSIFHNLIMVDASKMLLENTPETVKSIREDLEAKVQESEKDVKEAIDTLE